MKYFISTALFVILASFALTVPAQASASPIQIYRVYYNSPGTDTRSNASLNAEWVQLKNTSSTKRSIKGWKLRDASGHTYTFGTYTLSPGRYVTIHTGSRSPAVPGHLYWGSKAYIWNNTGDTAYLKTSTGSAADSCSWGSAGFSKYC